jgi:hypothetical protein
MVTRWRLQAILCLCTQIAAKQLEPGTITIKPLPLTIYDSYRLQPFVQFQQRKLFSLANIIKVDRPTDATDPVRRRLELQSMKLRLHKRRFTYILSLKY